MSYINPLNRSDKHHLSMLLGDYSPGDDSLIRHHLQDLKGDFKYQYRQWRHLAEVVILANEALSD